jgi:hypothetical protein
MVVGHTPTDDQIREFVKGLDILLTIETPYNWNAYEIAKKAGVKTVLIPMYEWLPPGKKEYKFIDLFLAESMVDYDKIPSPKFFLPTPVNRALLPFRRRTKAKVFLHNAGHGGVNARNGTYELLSALPLIHGGAKFIIQSQFHIYTSDKRVELIVGNVENYWDLWRSGDVFLFPCKFGGNFLPMNEAASVGMPIMATDFEPWNSFLPRELLIPVGRTEMNVSGTTVKAATLDPMRVAYKVNEWFGKDISKFSEIMNEQAEAISWENLRPKYEKIISDVVEGKQFN